MTLLKRVSGYQMAGVEMKFGWLQMKFATFMFHVKHRPRARKDFLGQFNVSRETFEISVDPRRVRYTSRMATAAGVTPGILAACPSVEGRTRANLSPTSRES